LLTIAVYFSFHNGPLLVVHNLWSLWLCICNLVILMGWWGCGVGCSCENIKILHLKGNVQFFSRTYSLLCITVLNWKKELIISCVLLFLCFLQWNRACQFPLYITLCSQKGIVNFLCNFLKSEKNFQFPLYNFLKLKELQFFLLDWICFTVLVRDINEYRYILHDKYSLPINSLWEQLNVFKWSCNYSTGNLLSEILHLM
jgi:hypothetical protein